MFVFGFHFIPLGCKGYCIWNPQEVEWKQKKFGGSGEQDLKGGGNLICII